MPTDNTVKGFSTIKHFRLIRKVKYFADLENGFDGDNMGDRNAFSPMMMPEEKRTGLCLACLFKKTKKIIRAPRCLS